MKDSLGILCSGLCVCHCVLTPIILASSATGLLGAVFASEWVHQALLLPVLILAGISLPSAFWRHRRILPPSIGAVGVCLLVGAWMVPLEQELWLTLTGGACLVLAHWTNRKYLTLGNTTRSA